MNKYLVLGSNSFAAAGFVNHCINQNNQVVGINRSAENSSIFLPVLKNPKKENYHFFNLDINHQIDEVLDRIDTFKPDFIVDFAGQGMVAESWTNPHHWYQTNIVAKAKIHRFLVGKNYLKNYIRISTPEVYGSNDGLIDELYPMNPSTPYAISHMATDLSMLALNKNFKLPVAIGRFANFYGPHQQLYRIIPKTIISILNNGILNLHGGGKSMRAFIHSEDVSRGIIKIAEKNKLGEIYHFSPEEFFSIKDIVQMICTILDVDFNAHTQVTDDRAGKDFAYLMSSKKAHSELQWSSQISLKEGILQTIEWAKENLDEINKLSLDYQHKE